MSCKLSKFGECPVAVADYLKGLREPAFVLTTLASFLFVWGMFLPFAYVILQVQKAGMDPTLVPYLLPIVNAVR